MPPRYAAIAALRMLFFDAMLLIFDAMLPLPYADAYTTVRHMLCYATLYYITRGFRWPRRCFAAAAAGAAIVDISIFAAAFS